VATSTAQWSHTTASALPKSVETHFLIGGRVRFGYCVTQRSRLRIAWSPYSIACACITMPVVGQRAFRHEALFEFQALQRSSRLQLSPATSVRGVFPEISCIYADCKDKHRTSPTWKFNPV
jgi:hypothetical protein